MQGDKANKRLKHKNIHSVNRNYIQTRNHQSSFFKSFMSTVTSPPVKVCRSCCCCVAAIVYTCTAVHGVTGCADRLIQYVE